MSTISLCSTLVAPPGTRERENFDDAINGKQQRAFAFAKVIARIAKEAAVAFKKRALVRFDGLVGDFGCERRAFRTLQLARRGDLEEEADRVITRVSVIVNKNCVNTFFETTWETFIQEKDLDIQLSDDFVYLVLSYLTCKTKRQKKSGNEEKETTAPEKLSVPSFIQGLGVTSLVDFAQCSLARMSVEWMVKRATDQRRFLSEPYLRNINERSGRFAKLSSPLFYNMDVVMQGLSGQEALVVLKNKITLAGELIRGAIPIELYFRGVGNGGFRSLEATEDRSGPRFVIEGFVAQGVTTDTLARGVGEIGLRELMLASAAQEWQYPALVQSPPSFPEIAAYGELALKIGCHKDNRSLIYIDHCFAEDQ